MTWLWHIKIKTSIFLVIALVVIILSITIVAGEMTILFQMEYSVFGDFIQTSAGLMSANIVSLVLLIYLAMCTYYGLFHLRLTSIYEFHPHQQTDSFSLIYSAMYLTKLSAPLCFNYCKLINVDGTAFHRMIGAMDPIPIIGH